MSVHYDYDTGRPNAVLAMTRRRISAFTRLGSVRKFKMFLKPDVVTPLNVTLTVGSQKIGKCPKGAICL